MDRRVIQFLHGFLGHPEDWNKVITCLPEYDCRALHYPFHIDPDAILVGYSMGGRIAFCYTNPKIVISSHPGLKTSEEKSKRFLDEQKWIQSLQTIPFSKFLEQWYEQSLFASLRKSIEFKTTFQRRLQQDPHIVLEMLSKERLSEQSYHADAVFLCGDFDTKYKEIYQKNHIDFIEIPNAGHAAHIENPLASAEILRTVLESGFIKK